MGEDECDITTTEQTLMKTADVDVQRIGCGFNATEMRRAVADICMMGGQERVGEKCFDVCVGSI